MLIAIQNPDEDRELITLQGIPKSFLPLSGKPALSWIYDELNSYLVKPGKGDVFVVCDAQSYQYCYQWSLTSKLSLSKLLNNGLTFGTPKQIELFDNIQSSFELFAKVSKSSHRISTLIIPGDIVCSPIDVKRLVDSVIAHVVTSDENCLFMSECLGKTENIPVAYLMQPQTLRKWINFEKQIDMPNYDYRRLVEFMADEDDAGRSLLYLPSLSLPWMESADLIEYKKDLSECLDGFLPDIITQMNLQTEIIITRCHARIGLMGNPSDAFEKGKTISISLPNFWVEVKLFPNTHLSLNISSINFLYNPLASNYLFPSLEALSSISVSDGYQSGDRLLQATCKVFHNYWTRKLKTIDSLSKQGFSLKLFSNIPKQVGLAGSSAIVIATWNALSKFYSVPDKAVPPDELASLVLEVERLELSITAGLQDRVIQAYATIVPNACGVYMDFSHPETPEENAKYNRDMIRNHCMKYQLPFFKYVKMKYTIPPGRYEILPLDKFPEGLWIAYSPDLGSDSGKVHQNVRKRFDAGDVDVIESVRKLANCAEQARQLFLEGDSDIRGKLAKLFDINFDTRRFLYGDIAIGKRNSRMIEIARECGFSAKFTGSGGAIVGIWRGNGKPDIETREMRLFDEEILQTKLIKEGFVFCYVDYK